MGGACALCGWTRGAPCSTRVARAIRLAAEPEVCDDDAIDEDEDEDDETGAADEARAMRIQLGGRALAWNACACGAGACCASCARAGADAVTASAFGGEERRRFRMSKRPIRAPAGAADADG